MRRKGAYSLRMNCRWIRCSEAAPEGVLIEVSGGGAEAAAPPPNVPSPTSSTAPTCPTRSRSPGTLHTRPHAQLE
ncbi:hypothetical protein E2C01_099236 [Portunus trituberculatus]|uniref:Uncharacterized protein n=1 Tax=Portunus trituberculatus TaxID=210409 RepID=A0A5B7KGB8_PORTR|nr:hypothetical protein [Portunus trituberculatus]